MNPGKFADMSCQVRIIFFCSERGKNQIHFIRDIYTAVFIAVSLELNLD